MSSPVITIAPDASVSTAMREMKRREISSLVVPLEDDVIGIVTQRDVVGKVVAAGLNPQQMTVREICTAPAVSIAPDTSLRECSARMMDLKVRRLPVVDEDNRVVGIIGETDIFMAVEERGWGPDELGESKLRSIGALARIRRMKVAEVMSRPVAMIAHDVAVSEALARMAERGISSLIVLPQAGTNVYGILTKRDVISKVVARNRDPQRLKVSEIMSAPVFTIGPHITLPQCAARMVAMGVRRLTVTQNEQPVGIISDTDIFRAVEGKRVSPLDRVVSAPRVPIRHFTKSHVHSAADVMEREVLRVPYDTTVSEALATMETNNVIILLVLPSQTGGPLGIVTQRDIVSTVVAQERDPDALTVGEISSAPLRTVSPHASLSECSEIMTLKNIRRLPVKDGDDIVGIVSDTDIFAAVEERGWEVETEHGEQPGVDKEQTPQDHARQLEGDKRTMPDSKRRAAESTAHVPQKSGSKAARKALKQAPIPIVRKSTPKPTTIRRKKR
jgi:isocitrate dehydrogenase